MIDWSEAKPPSLDDIEALARDTFAQLPAEFRAACSGVVIEVAEFPNEDTLAEMGAQSEFDILGLFRGQGLAQSEASPQTGTLPNQIWLYRRPLLDYWCEGADTLRAVVAHVLIHEIGHHFGLSDADMERIERATP